MRVPIALLALALVLATASRTPRTALPMLLLVWSAGACLLLRAILLGKARIAALPLYSGKLVSGGMRGGRLMLAFVGFCLVLCNSRCAHFRQSYVLNISSSNDNWDKVLPFAGERS